MKAASDSFRRSQTNHSEPRHQPGMSRKERNRTKNLRSKFVPALDEWSHEVVPRRSVASEPVAGFIQVPLQQHGGAVIQGMGQGCGRMNPLQAVIAERQ